MQRIFLDSEFNGFGGELISMGLVSDDGREWYKVIRPPANLHIHAWVQQNVLPQLVPHDSHYDGKPVDPLTFCDSLHKFVRQFPDAEIIADWPADIEHFCNQLTFGGMRDGFRLNWGCKFQLLAKSDPISRQPHNALADARALRDWYIKEHANGVAQPGAA